MSSSESERRGARHRSRRRASSDARTGVLVVDDSAFMRRLVTDIISDTDDFRVVGVAHDGREALDKIHRLDPDVVTLDVEMPELDGLQALGYIMSETPRPVVMLSAHTVEGGELTLRALDYGAVDFVAKPSGVGRDDVDAVGARLVQALRAASAANLSNLSVRIPTRRDSTHRPSEAAAAGPPAAVVGIAASTGGPRALLEIVSRIPSTLPASVLIVQHMPATFVHSFAERLDRAGPLPVRQAVDGEAIRAGRAYLAPGGQHMRVAGSRDACTIDLRKDPALWGVRPAADPLFESIAEVFGPAATGVVLTGMGRDGAAGARAILAAGGRALTQTRESCVVFGMPQASLQVGADAVPLDRMAGRIVAEVDRCVEASSGGA